MTDEEKAREIAAQNARPYGFGLNNDSSIECYQSAMQAMKWKDEQFSKTINGLPQSVNDLIETLSK